jgi:zinc transport system permease protein
MLQYEFMRIAFIAGVMLGIAIPLVGSTNVYKRLSMSGDALAHTSLAGVAIGLAAGLNPTILSIVFCILAFLVIEFMRKRFPRFSELGVALVLSAGIGIAGIASSFTSSANFDSYLFGSILLVDWDEIAIIGTLLMAVVVFYVFFYWRIFAVVYDEEEASINRVKVGILNFVQSLLTALTIAVSAKIIGSLIVSSLMVIPVAAALQIGHSYKTTLFYAVAFSLTSVIIGLIISYYWGLRPGATIVVVSLALLLLAMAYRQIKKSISGHLAASKS